MDIHQDSYLRLNNILFHEEVHQQCEINIFMTELLNFYILLYFIIFYYIFYYVYFFILNYISLNYIISSYI